MKTRATIWIPALLIAACLAANLSASPIVVQVQGRGWGIGHPIGRPFDHAPRHSIPPRRIFVAPPYHWPIIAPPPYPVVVPPPQIIVPVPTVVTVWIDNYNGSRTQVSLVRDGIWYIGPKGERYLGMPTEAQLRPLYGLGPMPHEQATVTVWIKTHNGAMKAVVLLRKGPDFVGPRGEYYAAMPTENQLRILYGD
ncbi:MAG: hypothetical protein JW828_07255 [Sedimentisphaerales bacterium]|nr:hypothetical protein [Sedimentisphaerales bacterium]